MNSGSLVRKLDFADCFGSLESKLVRLQERRCCFGDTGLAAINFAVSID